MASSTGATYPAGQKGSDKLPSVYSLPFDVFSMIIAYLPQASRFALFNTSRALRSSPALSHAMLVEPISAADFPTTLADARNGAPSILRSPFRTGLHERTSGCTDFMSLKGLGGLSEHEYLSSAKSVAICKLIDKYTGRHVVHLAIPYFLSLKDIRPYAQHCPNLISLDLANLIRIDGWPTVDNRYRQSSGPSQGFLRNLDWKTIFADCPSIFYNLRHIKLSLAGFDILNQQHRNGLKKILASMRRLEILELQGQAERRGFAEPRKAMELIEILTNHTARTLREIRLDRMLLSIRGLPYLLEKLSEKRPHFRQVVLSLNQDLKMMSKVMLEMELPLMDEQDEELILQGTPTSCCKYIRMLKALAEVKTASGESRWSITELGNDLDVAIRPEAFCGKGFPTPFHEARSDREDYFRYLKHHMNWRPTFAWSSETDKIEQPYYNKLQDLSEPELAWTLARCKETFHGIRDAGMPVKLELLAEQQDHENPGRASFFLEDWVPHTKAACSSHKYMTGLRRPAGPWHWYFHGIGNAIDHLKVAYGNAFLREPFDLVKKKHPQGRYGGRPGGYRFDARPQAERAAEEKAQMQPMWDDLAENFPVLSRLELYIPELVYLGDVSFLDNLLPGAGWQVEQGKDVIVKDYRECEGLTPQADVVFLNRVFFREEVAW